LSNIASGSSGASGIQDHTYGIDECEKINYHATIWVNRLKRVGRTADNEINLRRVRDWLKNLEDNLLQAERTIAERDSKLQDTQNALENAETLNGILQEDLARITEKPRSLSGGSSSERVSIGTLQEEFDRSIGHHRNLSEQLDDDLSASISSLILPPVEPEENLSPQKVCQLLE
jgi:chromosome segregation ATPase